ncbi:MAG: GSCFA domain-containing protein [Spirosomataceae bacterium]
MNFRTELHIPENTHKITLQTPILTLGSCFAEVMGGRFKANKIPTLANPFGTVFNPISMAKLLTQAIENQVPDPQLYIENQGVWFHYDFHSSLWADSREALEVILLQKISEVHQWLQKTKFLMITFGTAFMYRHLETQQIVANCHKIPASSFQRTLLDTATIVDTFQDLQNLLTAHYDLQTILTVSPVRHTRDTLPLNAVSKSILRVACHELNQNTSIHYFPAYEILLDDLRDYRFYQPDLIHPTEVAETYIFDKFSNAYFDETLKAFIIEWHKLQKALNHVPLQTHSVAHQAFLKNLFAKLEQMAHKVDMGYEIDSLKSRINA